MSAASRRKGLTGEREVAQLFIEHFWEVRGLEGLGDMLAILATHDPEPMRPLTAHLEVKRYRDRARWPQWWGQTKSEAPPGAVPMLCAREDHGEWLSLLRTADLLDVIA